MSLSQYRAPSVRRNAPLLWLLLALPISLLTHCADSNGSNQVVVPDQSCSGGSSSSCELPRSQCDGPGWLVYFENPTCVNGTCKWEQNRSSCPGNCVNGGCSLNSTTTTCMPSTPGCGGSGGQPGSGGRGGTGGGAPIPVVPCSSLGQCELPRSVCNNGSFELTYYTNGRCEAGFCNWDVNPMYCPTGCVNGGCTLSSTTTTCMPPTPGCGFGGQSGGGGSSGNTSSAGEGGAAECVGGAGAGGQSQCAPP
jgi:hypothetical protein